MELIAIVDFFDDTESIALRHSGPDPDSIYADIQDAFEAEGFDTITLFELDDQAVQHLDTEKLVTLPTTETNQVLFTVTTDNSGRIFAVDPNGKQLAAIDLHGADDDDPMPFVALARDAFHRLNMAE